MLIFIVNDSPTLETIWEWWKTLFYTWNTTFHILDVFKSSGEEASTQFGMLEVANVHLWTTEVSQLY
jgi:hypothetical protein